MTSCRNYNGHDISGDMQQVIDEVQAMAIQCKRRNSPMESQALSTCYKDCSAWILRVYHTVHGYFASFTLCFPPPTFVVICDDPMVNLKPNFIRPIPDPRGIWTDHVHEWIAHYDQYTPCDPLRKPGGLTKENAGFSIYQRSSKAV